MASAILTWNANTELDLASYRIYRKVGAAPFTLLATVPKPATTYTDSSLPLIDGDITYDLTAVDTTGNESAHSVSVTKTVNLVPPVAPTGLVVVIS
jgi:fibronectin type 3 domain-containing protein